MACDGKAECWNDEDEKNCKRDEIEILLGERNSTLFSSLPYCTVDMLQVSLFL